MRWDIYKHNGSEAVRFTANVVGEKLDVLSFIQIEALETYFANYTPDPTLLDRQVGLFELMTRFFLFKSSTPQERLEAIVNHFD